MAGFVMVEAETENPTMLAFLDHRRIVNENRPIQAAEIGRRDQQVQPCACREQGFCRGIRSLHGRQAIKNEGGETTAIKGA